MAEINIAATATQGKHFMFRLLARLLPGDMD
jgi:hypothetical protein